MADVTREYAYHHILLQGFINATDMDTGKSSRVMFELYDNCLSKTSFWVVGIV